MSGSVLVAVLLALAVTVALLPARRDASELEQAALEQVALEQVGAVPRVPTHEPGERTSSDLDLALVLTEVATLLQAGATPARAWSRTLGRHGLTQGAEPGPDGVPPALQRLGREAGLRWWVRWWPRRRGGRWVWEPGWPASGTRAARRRATAAAVPGAVAACRLSAALGAPLAAVLESVAQGVAESGRAESSRRTALSGPMSTARLLACLPVLGVVLGSAVGARPQEVLLDGGAGSLLGAGGLGLMALGGYVTHRLVRAAQREGEGADEALVLDLAAAALAGGASVPGTLSALAPALDEPACAVVARGLLLGAAWHEAWSAPQDEDWRARRSNLEACLRPGWEDGASPVPLLEATAQSLRAGRQARDQEVAERLAVRLVIPLGLCHLPAFVALGIVPVVVSVGLGLVAG
ncbi:hypothetical protein [Actinomyces faecalis]|uniref:hypothetical protein n=1 Tax=Actinomyces faecalis TaxID=2722820 RepID=UPI0015575AAD|nr:hypothetical protein [Actinomyces faecalis]